MGAEPARKLIRCLNSYSESSPSGTGVHIIVRAVLPAGGKRAKHKGLNVELYDRGRYFTKTGWVLGNVPTTIEDRQDELTALCATVFPKSDPPQSVQPPQRQRDHDEQFLCRQVRAGSRF